MPKPFVRAVLSTLAVPAVTAVAVSLLWPVSGAQAQGTGPSSLLGGAGASGFNAAGGSSGASGLGGATNALGGLSGSGTGLSGAASGLPGATPGGLGTAGILGGSYGTPAAGTPAANASRGTRPEPLDPQGLSSGMRPLPPLEPSAFQRFVEASTGQLLPTFGAALFTEMPEGYMPIGGVPVPADYVIGPGDEVQVRASGLVEFDLRQAVDRSGQIVLPRVGTVSLAGIKLADLEKTIAAAIGRNFKNVQIHASLGQLRGIDVFVVGHARRPGRYTLSSLSTLVNVIFASGGPTADGSMRRIELVRAGKVVGQMDLYDFILRGDRSRDSRLQPGDTVVFAPTGPRVALMGAVASPAVYELNSPQVPLAQVLALAGGASVLADRRRVQLERVNPANGQRVVEPMALDDAGLAKPLRDGDVLALQAITPQFANAITLRGHVAAPLRHAYTPGMRVRDLIPNPDALITRDFWIRRNQLVQFDEDPQAAGRAGFADAQRDAQRREALRRQSLTNAALQAGTPGATALANALINPQAAGSGLNAGAGGLGSAGAGAGMAASGAGLGQTPGLVSATGATTSPEPNPFADPTDGKPPSDTLLLNPALAPRPNPIQSLRRSLDQVNWDYAVIERLDRATLKTQLIPFNLGRAVQGQDASQNLELQPGDVVTIFSAKDLQAPRRAQNRLVQIEGEVAAPGVYAVAPGETLPQLVARIGGLTPEAYVFGTALQRESVRKQQEQNMEGVLRRLEDQTMAGIAQRQANLTAVDATNVAIQQQRIAAEERVARERLARLRQLRPSGRVALEMNDQAPELPGIAMEDGDRLLVPARPSFVAVAGAVHNENVLVHRAGRSLNDYLRSAGPTESADVSQAFVLRADGSVLTPQQPGGWLSLGGLVGGGLGGFVPSPGDTIIVPEKIDRETRYTVFMRNLKDWTQIVYQLGLGAAAIKVLRD